MGIISSISGVFRRKSRFERLVEINNRMLQIEQEIKKDTFLIDRKIGVLVELVQKEAELEEVETRLKSHNDGKNTLTQQEYANAIEQRNQLLASITEQTSKLSAIKMLYRGSSEFASREQALEEELKRLAQTAKEIIDQMITKREKVPNVPRVLKYGEKFRQKE